MPFFCIKIKEGPKQNGHDTQCSSFGGGVVTCVYIRQPDYSKSRYKAEKGPYQDQDYDDDSNDFDHVQ